MHLYIPLSGRQAESYMAADPSCRAFALELQVGKRRLGARRFQYGPTGRGTRVYIAGVADSFDDESVARIPQHQQQALPCKAEPV